MCRSLTKYIQVHFKINEVRVNVAQDIFSHLVSVLFTPGKQVGRGDVAGCVNFDLHWSALVEDEIPHVVIVPDSRDGPEH